MELDSTHSLDIAGFMRVAYYDYGGDVFNSAVDDQSRSRRHACRNSMHDVLFHRRAGDTATTQEEFSELLEAMCPIFDEVLSGEERINGAQFATMRGIGCGMEINKDERNMRLYTNASLTQ